MNAHHVIALDIGGTSMKGAVIGPDLRPVRTLRSATPRTGAAGAVLAAVTSTVDRLTGLAAEHGITVTHAGVAVPGIVDDDLGHVHYSANLGLSEVPLAAVLRRHTGLNVTVGHDVRAGALAEATLGAARGARHALFVAIGTGIAGAFITDGLLLRSGGHAGEIGHITVPGGTARCACGNRGCLETVAAAPALAKALGERTGRAVEGAVDVAAAVRAGDPDAQAVWQRAVAALAGVLAALTTTLGPDTIVVGGGLGEASDLLIRPLTDALEERLTFQRRPAVLKALLGDQAGCIGAALLARGGISSTRS
ncbi:ROK family protein [Kitasatospora sp. NPDC005751]|uniref:ROK family protein n=1 Tax=unclassified Kitasatospora TaxID=2633591 RepID=UPI003403A9E1